MSTEQELERLSALVDGALGDREGETLLAQIADQAALRGHWGRYHLIGDALRGEIAAGAALGVAGRVRERLAAEPVVLAPALARRRRLPGWTRPALGLAAAASFGAAVVLLLPHAEQSAPGPTTVAALTGPAATPVEGPGQWTVVQQVPVTRWQARDPGVEPDLHRYLADHSEFAATGVKGALPLVTLVGYDARR
jgi:sigma-E factor negative regulatory protein RseA